MSVVSDASPSPDRNILDETWIEKRCRIYRTLDNELHKLYRINRN